MLDCGVHYLWFAFVCFLIRSPPPSQMQVISFFLFTLFSIFVPRLRAREAKGKGMAWRAHLFRVEIQKKQCCRHVCFFAPKALFWCTKSVQMQNKGA